MASWFTYEFPSVAQTDVSSTLVDTWHDSPDVSIFVAAQKL